MQQHIKEGKCSLYTHLTFKISHAGLRLTQNNFGLYIILAIPCTVTTFIIKRALNDDLKGANITDQTNFLAQYIINLM